MGMGIGMGVGVGAGVGAGMVVGCTMSSLPLLRPLHVLLPRATGTRAVWLRSRPPQLHCIAAAHSCSVATRRAVPTHLSR